MRFLYSKRAYRRPGVFDKGIANTPWDMLNNHEYGSYRARPDKPLDAILLRTAELQGDPLPGRSALAMRPCEGSNRPWVRSINDYVLKERKHA